MSTITYNEDIQNFIGDLCDAARTGNGFVLEIGPAKGDGSTRAFEEGLRESKWAEDGKLFISVDHQDYMDVKPTAPYWHMVMGDSRSVDTALEVQIIAGGRKADVIFIDTHHTYEQMRDELPVWVKLADRSTTWLFHDTHMLGAWNPMNRAILEFAAAHQDSDGGWEFEDWRTEMHGLGRMRWVRHEDKQKVKPFGLNIGSGQRHCDKLLGWVNIDCASRPPDQVPDLICDVGKELLPYEDNSVQFVLLHHVYEHFGPSDGHKVVREANRVLKPGGSLILTLPDMQALAKRWLLGQINDYIYFINVYGAYQGLEGDRHKWGYTDQGLKEDLQAAMRDGPKWAAVKSFDWRIVPGADISRDWWIKGIEAVK